MPRKSTVHPADIPSQSSNGNRGPRSSKHPYFHNPFPTMFRRQTAIHPDIPQLNIEIANRWIENPLIDPYNKKVVPLSIHPKSRYVFLYKKIMDALINDIRNAFPQEEYKLTIEDCKYIKNNLPIIHSIINIPSNSEYITYEHLFINPQEGYILTTRDCKYIKKILPIIHSKIETPDPDNNEYMTYHRLFTNPQEGYILTEDDCNYINTNMSIVHYEINISDNSEYITYDHLFIKYFVKRTRKYKFDSSYCEDSEIKLYLNIYNAIKTKDPTIKKTGFRAKLKEYKNMANKALSRVPFKKTAVNQSSKSQSFAKDNYVLIKDLLKNNMDLDKTDISIGKLVLNMCIDFKYILYMQESMITLENYKIALHNQKTLKYVNYIYHMKFANGNIYNDIENYYNQISSQILPAHNVEEIKFIYSNIFFKIYQTNQYIFNSYIAAYDTILSLYARFFNKYIDPSVLIKKDVVKLSKSSSSKKDVVKLNPYCEKDVIDPNTQEPIHELGEKDRKYVVTILSYNKNTKKVNYYCFDTIEIYNYILNCIQDVKKIKNPFLTDINFTDDDLDEICNKIKFLTNKPTYNSHVDIKEAIKKRFPIRIKVVNKYLKFLQEMEKLIEVIGKLQKLEANEEELEAEAIKLEAEAIRMVGFEILENTKKELKQESEDARKLQEITRKEGLGRNVEILRELKEIETRNKKLEEDVKILQEIIIKGGLEKLNNKLFIYESEYNEYVNEAIRLNNLHEENTYNNYLQISFGEGIEEYEEGSEEYKRVDIIGEYNYYISINLGNMQLRIINSILADNIDNNVSYLENKENSFIIRLPIFKNVDYNDKIKIFMQKIGEELGKLGKIGKLGEYDYKFPCRENNKKIIDLPPFDFDMNEDAKVVFERFQKHIKIKTNIKYIKRIKDIERDIERDIQNNVNIY
jgi:hypothetical protein